MMKLHFVLLIALVVVVALLGGCKDLPPGGPGGTTTAIVFGVVYDLNSGALIANPSVTLTAGGKTKTVVGGGDGRFQFEVETPASGSITVRKTGYQTKTVGVSVTADTTLDIGLDIDYTTYSVISGKIRDSVSLYPLRNTHVVLSIPGFIDSVTTGTDGAFRFAVDLIDRDSLPIVLIVRHDGYKIFQKNITVRRGQLNLPDVLMAVDARSSIAQIVGRILDRQNLNPMANASILLSSNIKTDSTLTAFDGSFSFSVNLSGLSSITGFVKITKSGYRSSVFNFTVGQGQTFSQDVLMDRDTTTGIRDSSGTGSAHSIAFIGATAYEISVYGVGGTESTILTWEVRDSLGFPIDFDHRDTVTFALIGTPVSGGAYVSPAKAITNASGRVATTVNSGTVSGVLQFVATLRRNSDGVIIQSTPVLIDVDAGLPDQAHFTIGPRNFNFAGYNWLGRENQITVQVGDKYTNPVKIGTAVYFNTTGGIVEAAAFTDATGHSTNTLFSGNPLPKLTTLGFPALYGDGTGYGYVRAHTLGENGIEVKDSVLILFSGYPVITASTYTFAIPKAGAQNIAINISDINGNPLAPGTLVRTEVQFAPPLGTNWAATASGLPEDPFDDWITRGPGHTDFTLRVADGTPGGTPDYMPVVVKIRVTGDNGNIFTTLSGTVGDTLGIVPTPPR